MEPVYNTIGVDYNLTRKADPYLTDRLFHHLNPSKDGMYLDIGCGSGNYTSALQKKGGYFIGIDPSSEMLEKAKGQDKQIDWRIGVAEKTGVEPDSVDGIIASLTIHHWTDLHRSFTELGRILKTDGKIVIFTTTPEQMNGYWLNHYFPKMLERSISQMPSLEKVKDELQHSGIEIVDTENYSIKPDLKDLFLYSGKENPALYFRDDVRRGISSFSSLSNQPEVDQGLSKLRNDIDNRRIRGVIESYANHLGDYLFIIGKKNAEF